MKRMIALVLSVATILSLMGCGNSNKADGSSISDSNTKTDTNKDESSLNNSQMPDDSRESYAMVLSSAVYPEMAPYPDEMDYVNEEGGFDEAFYDAYDAWWEGIRERRLLMEDYSGELDSYIVAGIRQYLADSQGQNKVFSPLNVYMALGMLAEITDGESRSQVLDLLGVDSVEDLRAQVDMIWNAVYRNDGANICVLASSLWLSEDINFVQPTMDSLARNYYASSYQGVMGSDELNQALQSWLDEQTGGLLEEQSSNVKLDADTIMALAATINFHAKWSNEFLDENTQEGVFHGAGGDLNCDFMHQSHARFYYWGEKFSAISQNLENDSAMWFILPDEGVSVDELIDDEQTMKFLLSGGREWQDSTYLVVNLALPKFDVSSDMDLIPGLKALGVTDVFDPSISDYTPMTTDVGEIYLSQAKHAARVKIDEEGCTAAAYTVMALMGAGLPPEEEVDFVMDRPFIFAIIGSGNLPLFVGIVNQPV